MGGRGSQIVGSGAWAVLWTAFVTVAILAGGTSDAAAQLCAWDGTPTVPAPAVDVLGSRPDSLRAPSRVAVDSDNRLLVTDPTRGVVVVHDAAGATVASHGGLGVPLAVAVDSFDRVYVSDAATGRVARFDSSWQPDGELGSGAGEFQLVTDIAVDPDPGLGRVYVADGAADQIRVFGPDGLEVLTFGGAGTGAGELDFPAAIWVSPLGEVYVGDQNNDRVQVFDRNGVFLRCFGAQGGLNRSFGRIQGLTGDADGRVYVVDAFQDHVKVFDGAGATVSVIGGFGDRPGQLRTPFGAVVDGHGRLVVSSVNSGRLEVFGLDDYTVPPPGGWVFGDGFESGDVNGWSAAVP